jgi:hypothetical protein
LICSIAPLIFENKISFRKNPAISKNTDLFLINDLPLLKNLENIPKDIVENNRPLRLVNEGKNRDFLKLSIKIAGFISLVTSLGTKVWVNTLSFFAIIV